MGNLLSKSCNASKEWCSLRCTTHGSSAASGISTRNQDSRRKNIQQRMALREAGDMVLARGVIGSTISKGEGSKIISPNSTYRKNIRINSWISQARGTVKRKETITSCRGNKDILRSDSCQLITNSITCICCTPIKPITKRQIDRGNIISICMDIHPLQRLF